MTARRVFPIVLILCAIVAGLYICSVSGHAKTGHTAELVSSMDALGVMELAARSPGACKVLVVASCLFAVNRDKTSWHFGELSPQARVYCGTHESGIMGVFGLKSPDNPVYITGYVVTKARFDKYCERDACAFLDVTYLQWLVR